MSKSQQGEDGSAASPAPPPRVCAACGRPLPAKARPTMTRCRLCAAQIAQAYVLEALASRRRRRGDAPS